jgi:hypothetical protein
MVKVISAEKQHGGALMGLQEYGRSKASIRGVFFVKLVKLESIIILEFSYKSYIMLIRFL